MNSQNILITGGCGFVGVNLVNYLLRKDFRYIKILDNLSTGTRENLEDALRENGALTSNIENNNVTYSFAKNLHKHLEHIATVDVIIGDIRSYEACLKVTEDIDSVIHLAAHAGIIPSIEDPFYDCEVNVKGTLNLLYASVRNNIDKFIFASSNAPLGDHSPPTDEKTVPNPLSPYGASKLACEGYCSAFYGSYGLKTLSLRFSNVYGPHSLHKRSVVAEFIRDALLRSELTIYGDGHQTRDFIHVDDICQAICLILENPLATGPLTPAYDRTWGISLNLGTGEETSILELAKIINGLFPGEIRISFAPEREGEIKRNYSDITRAKKLLGFSPQISLRNGVSEVYRWFIKNPLTGD